MIIPPELKSILKDLSHYKNKLAVVAITGILSALSKGALPLFVQKMISSASHIDQLMSIAWIGILIAFVMSASRYIHIYTMNVVAENVSQGLRSQLQNKFIHLDLKFHNKYVTGSGGLLSRTFNDVRVIHDGLRLFADLFTAPLTFIFLITALFKLDFQLTLYILIIAPILISILRQISKSIRKYSSLGVEQLEKITSTVKESLDGVRTIQAFSLQKILSTKMVNQGHDYVELRKKVHARIEFMGPFAEFLATLIILGIFFYFSAKISNGTSDAGILMGYVTAMLQVNEPIKKFQDSFVKVQETRVSAVRVYSMIEEKSTLDDTESKPLFPKSWQEIEYRNIDFSYENEKLLNNFSLKIKRGQTIALVGESGSGKTTIANLLPRFYDPQAGEILVDHVNIKTYSLESLRQHIALVSQDVFLFSDSLEKNIQAGSAEFDFGRIQASAQAAHAHDFILKTPEQYKTNVGERGNLLSGGEKQRVAIARALYKNADILILDEATSALDSVSEEHVQRGLDELMKGKTTLVIAHRLSTVQNADLILVMKKGRIVEAGNHSQLLDLNGEYKKLFTSQTKV